MTQGVALGWIGGGAYALTQEIERRGLKKAIVGIPKTIDNDIKFLDKSFGFETAFGVAVQALKCAHTESPGSVMAWAWSS